ncbi:hypothetical protein PHMEG_0005860 [Phytophthora megakarya]|uniref:Bzip transcription factor n=1 Tax=Phytophthora megakarya TaxID=4795 RepID=A0A225WQI0_9STRA|nr:hypothetical protein PHMEG_0005860 [Phytophthora megakarya]
MNYNTLVSPNYFLLSDEVIGSVAPRSQKCTTRTHHTGYPSSSKPRRNQPTVIDKRWCTEHVEEIAGLINMRNKIKKEQRRLVQKKYREKQINATSSLETSIQRLQDEVQALKTIGTAIQPSKNVWSVATGYFNTLQRCLREQTQFNSAATQFDSLHHFVQETTTPDVLNCEEHGSEELIKNVSILQLFDDVDMILEGIHSISTHTVVAITKTSLSLTEKTLRNVFPHLFDAGTHCTSMCVVAEKLRGQQIFLSGSTRFVWDTESERVVSILFKSDMITPILRILGNLEDVSRVFEGALITPDFCRRTIS